MKLTAAPLPDRIERPFHVPDDREDQWLRDQLKLPAMPWETGDTTLSAT